MHAKNIYMLNFIKVFLKIVEKVRHRKILILKNKHKNKIYVILLINNITKHHIVFNFKKFSILCK